jgi:hypothetical protein
MRRREFLGVLGGVAATPSLLWPLAGHAQQGERILCASLPTLVD